ncbi:hypothetical protein [Pandoraea sp. NPDC087047]|uniref:hypothetical protein n=1 Tax=Pandoraea sp. NPDC087047 TaxID=3364390 RepID=UPI0037FA4AF6
MFKALSNVDIQGYSFDRADTKTVDNLKAINTKLHDLRVMHRLHEPMIFASKFERVENLQKTFRDMLKGASEAPPALRPSPVTQMELAKLRKAVGPVAVPPHPVTRELSQESPQMKG